MNKLRVMFFLLLATFSNYCFTDSSENKMQIKDLNFNAYLRVEKVHKEGLVLVLNDGSEWDIKYFDGLWKLLGWGWTEQKEVSHWTMGDVIEVQYPNSGNLTDFVLVINNISRNEKSLARLKQAPSINYSACLWVVDFDENTNRVKLNDGTVWFKTKTDMYNSAYRALSQQTSSSQGKWEIGDKLTLIRGEDGLSVNDCFLWNHSINEMPCVNRLE